MQHNQGVAGSCGPRGRTLKTSRTKSHSNKCMRIRSRGRPPSPAHSPQSSHPGLSAGPGSHTNLRAFAHALLSAHDAPHPRVSCQPPFLLFKDLGEGHPCPEGHLHPAIASAAPHNLKLCRSLPGLLVSIPPDWVRHMQTQVCACPGCVSHRC